MSRYVLSDLSIANFKLIEPGSPLRLAVKGKKLLMFSGPNGYGKSTVFDAIELLLMGELRHFKASLKHGGETLQVVAHDRTQDMVFEGGFTDGQNCLKVQRVFFSEGGFVSSRLAVDGEPRTDAELWDALGISKDAYHLGCYISQSDSLAFLENSHKSRRGELASLIDTAESDYKADSLKAVYERFAAERRVRNEALGDKLRKLETLHGQKSDAFAKLKEREAGENSEIWFPLYEQPNTYGFDQREPDFSVGYEIVIEPVRRLLELVENFTDYINTLYNNNLAALLQVQQTEYKALYFDKELGFLRERAADIRAAVKLEQYHAALLQGNYYVDQESLGFAGFPAEGSQELQMLLALEKSKKDTLGREQKALTELSQQRERFLRSYRQEQLPNTIPRDTCPLCGTSSSELQEMFDKMGALLQNALGEHVLDHQQYANLVKERFTEEVLPAIEARLAQWAAPLLCQKELGALTALRPVALEQKLKLAGQVFEAPQTDGKFEEKLAAFPARYEAFTAGVAAARKPVRQHLTQQQLDQYAALMQTYYPGLTQPGHTAEQLTRKLSYLSDRYSDSLMRELQGIAKEIEKLEGLGREMNRRMEEGEKRIKRLAEKYKDCRASFVNDLLNGIALPLYIFSGKVLQNYPMGLGIRTSVKDSNIELYPDGSDNDIYNQLSTGQLNGVMISVLLSIKAVFPKVATEGGASLDMLLIDDPLQTVDDISAVSFLDLLTSQFAEQQVFFSTHEDVKASLIYNKYASAGMDAMVLNLQEEYMKAGKHLN